ncbi:MAG: type II secretion system minor pseudopilin GspI, partial [Pseudomonadota bacterium]
GRADLMSYSRKPVRWRLVAAFTLIEMLLAMTVIAVVGITISSAVGGVASQTYTLERRTMAHWVGQNQLHRIRINQRRVQPDGSSPGLRAKDTTRVFMGERDWEILTTVTSTDLPTMQRVEVDVYELQDGERVGPFDHQVAFVGRN